MTIKAALLVIGFKSSLLKSFDAIPPRDEFMSIAVASIKSTAPRTAIAISLFDICGVEGI